MLKPKIRILLSTMCAMACAETGEPVPQHKDFRNLAMINAANDYEAGDYDHALDLYEKLMEQELNRWESSVIKYNSATALIAKGSYIEAIDQLESISIAKDAPPLIVGPIKANLAVARLSFAQKLFTDLKMAPPLSVDPYNRILRLLQESIKNMSEAESAFCRLGQMEGEAECPPSENFSNMRALAKALQGETLLQSQDFQIRHATLNNSILSVHYGIDLALSHIDFLKEHQLGHGLNSQYTALFASQEKSWFPLWEDIQNKLKFGNSEKRDLFEKAKASYWNGVAAMQTGNFDKSREAFAVADSSIFALAKLIWGQNPLLEILHKLLDFYQRVLVQDPVQEQSLISLKTEQERMIQLVKSSIKEQEQHVQEFAALDQNLSQSIALTQQGLAVEGRMYLEEADMILKRLLRVVAVPSGSKAEAILSAAIEDQRHSMTLLNLWQRISSGGNASVEARKLLPLAKTSVLKTASSFLQEVFAQEVKEFKKGHCQKKPWDEVIPLFNRGEEAAIQENNLIGQKFLNAPLASTYGQEALKDWEMALAKMREEPEETSEENQEAAATKQEELSPDLSKTSSEQVLRSLQQMELDDRSLKKAPTTGTNTMVPRPW